MSTVYCPSGLPTSVRPYLVALLSFVDRPTRRRTIQIAEIMQFYLFFIFSCPLTSSSGRLQQRTESLTKELLVFRSRNEHRRFLNKIGFQMKILFQRFSGKFMDGNTKFAARFAALRLAGRPFKRTLKNSSGYPSQGYWFSFKANLLNLNGPLLTERNLANEALSPKYWSINCWPVRTVGLPVSQTLKQLFGIVIVA